LAQASGTLTAVFVVEFEVKRALEWLQDATHQSRRYAAVLVLKELAENAPTLFYVHVSSFFDLVWYLPPLDCSRIVLLYALVDCSPVCYNFFSS
jgi:FKBP12-rapamycin complex-associated protein